MNTESLKAAGLTDGEINVYAALLQIGSSTTGKIVSQSGVSRSIVQYILEKLMKKGLTSYIIQEKTKHYQAAEPGKILDYIDERQKQLEADKKAVEQILPQLEKLQESVPESQVKVFIGFKGVITVHEHLYDKLEKGEEYFYFGIPAEQPKHFHAYWKRDHIRRVNAGIKCKLLFHPDTKKATMKNRNSYVGCDARYMPVDIDTPAWFIGYKNVAVIGLPSSNPVTIEIVNQEIATSFQSYFDSFWSESKPFKQR